MKTKLKILAYVITEFRWDFFESLCRIICGSRTELYVFLLSQYLHYRHKFQSRYLAQALPYSIIDMCKAKYYFWVVFYLKRRIKYKGNTSLAKRAYICQACVEKKNKA